jgi:hypothetical protein
MALLAPTLQAFFTQRLNATSFAPKRSDYADQPANQNPAEQDKTPSAEPTRHNQPLGISRVREVFALTGLSVQPRVP